MRLDYCFLTENEDDDDFSKVLADNREVSRKAAADEPGAPADEQGPPEENEDDVAEIFGECLTQGRWQSQPLGLTRQQRTSHQRRALPFL